MTTTIHTYNEVNVLRITVMGDGSCRRHDPWLYHRREVINKMACYFPYDSYDLISELYDETEGQSIAPGSKLYVAKECKTGRDTFRNSGYSIVLDPARADAIIVPDINARQFHRMDCNIVAKDTNNGYLYLVDVDKSGYSGNTSLTDSDMLAAKKYLTEAMGLTVDEAQQTALKVWFMPKCKEIQGVLEDHRYQIPYLQESLVPIKPSTTISPETLLFWENIDDMNLLVRTICTSDWIEYPTTLLAFLTCFKQDVSNWFTYANGDFRRILSAIGYTSYSDFKYLVQNRTISPKDYEMLQKYVYFKLGIDENGGVVDPRIYNAVPSSLRPYLQRKIALKPLTIPGTMRLDKIVSIIDK